MRGSYLYRLYRDELARTFVDGHIFITPPDLADAEHDPGVGYWHCDIAAHDELAWSKTVNALFGLPAETSVTRDWAVAHYAEQDGS